MDIKDDELIKYAQLDLLNEFKKICEQNNIKYFLTGGTLIGAIRHNGFIPWDDDIDVGMLRNEYEKFLEIAPRYIDSNYELFDWNKDLNSPLPFLKLKIKGTHYKEFHSQDSKMNDSIFIDIFPYDNVPSSHIKKILQAIKIFIYRKLLLIKCNFNLTEGKIGKKIIYAPIYLLSIFYDLNELKNKCIKEMKKYNTHESNYIINHAGSYSYNRETINREWIENTIMHKFEKYEYMIPKMYNEFLTHVYGNYMKLPPQEQQTGRHRVKIIDLGNYKIRSIQNSNTEEK